MIFASWNESTFIVTNDEGRAICIYEGKSVYMFYTCKYLNV